MSLWRRKEGLHRISGTTFYEHHHHRAPNGIGRAAGEALAAAGSEVIGIARHAPFESVNFVGSGALHSLTDIRSPVTSGLGDMPIGRVGGRWTLHGPAKGWIVPAIVAESALLGVAAAVSAVPGLTKIYGVIAATALAMGLRNAVVRKFSIPDMTTTVLTLTVTGIAADSSLAGGNNPHWQRRMGAVAAMLIGAAVGAAMVGRSLTATLALCVGIAGACALAQLRFESERKQ